MPLGFVPLQWGRDLSISESTLIVANPNGENSVLQWGRDLSVLESIAPESRIVFVGDALQCGRDLNASEGCEPVMGQPDVSSFNGAET